MGIRRQDVAEILRAACRQLTAAGCDGAMLPPLERLAAEVESPCTVAVIGRMSRGKSQLLNAFFGQYLAKVDAKGTTSTINRFVYGKPRDSEKPVRCKWLDRDRPTEETLEFAHSLQGGTQSQLDLAGKIEYLEFLRSDEILKDFVFVDTPGRGSAVREHSERAESVIQLTERLDQQTNTLTRKADAVIYLMQQTTRDEDRSVLGRFNERFSGRKQGHVVNAIAVVSMIDKYDEWLNLATRPAKTQRVADELRGLVAAVVPVSAGLCRAIQCLDANDELNLDQFVATIRRIPLDKLDDMLTSESMFEDQSFECGLDPAQRARLHRGMEWNVFKALAWVAFDSALSVDEVRMRAVELSGFPRLVEVLKTKFFKWHEFLRSYRVLHDARQVVQSLQREQLPELKRQQKSRNDAVAEIVNVLKGAAPRRAAELISILREISQSADNVEAIGQAITNVATQLDQACTEINQRHDEVAALQITDDLMAQQADGAPLLTAQEAEELKTVLGAPKAEALGDLTPADLRAKAAYWADLADAEVTSDDSLRFVAETAAERLRLLSERAADDSP